MPRILPVRPSRHRRATLPRASGQPYNQRFRPPCEAAVDKILIRGARTHNLKNVDLTLPRDKLIVITGLPVPASLPWLSTRSMRPAALRGIPLGLRPAVPVDDGEAGRGHHRRAVAGDFHRTEVHFPQPTPTVGTITEIYDYLRLLYARVGTPRCPDHDIPLEAQTVSQMVDQVLALPEGSKLMLLAPVIRERKGEHLAVFDEMRAQGFVRARVDGKLYELDEVPKLDKQKKHSIDVVVDRFVRADLQQRLAESFETALSLADGIAPGSTDGRGRGCRGDHLLGALRLPVCGHSISELEPKLFSSTTRPAPVRPATASA